jgi:hypothetical protein
VLFALIDAGLSDERICAEFEAEAHRAALEAERRAARAS